MEHAQQQQRDDDDQSIPEMDSDLTMWMVEAQKLKANAPFYWHKASGDFEVMVQISGHMETMYDKAGLVIRHDAEHWITSGIEYFNGCLNHSTSVTRDYTDWSLCPLPHPTNNNKPPNNNHNKEPGAAAATAATATTWVCIKRIGNTFESFYSLTGTQWVQTRQGLFHEDADSVRVGIYCACPMRNDGFTVQFDK
ncbi:hypothetical protein ACA910_009071 [Epithemia clementina (nom. ined.)]